MNNELKDKVSQASANVFQVAVDAIKENPNYKKVVIVNRAPRIDKIKDDRYHLKSQLSDYGNQVYKQLLEKCNLKNKIVIGQHNFEGVTDRDIFGDPDQPRYDGVHLAGKHGRYYYTRSVCKILQQAGIIPEGRLFKQNGKPSNPHSQPNASGKKNQ